MTGIQSLLSCKEFEGIWNIRSHAAIARIVAGLFFPVAAKLQRPPRENVTPLLLEKIVWSGANLGSYQHASHALQELAGVQLTVKQVQRISSQIGSDDVRQRQAQVTEHQSQPLMQRLAAPPGVTPPDLGVVMMDGGRFQRRDHFRPRQNTSPSEAETSLLSDNVKPAATAGIETAKTHWREDKVGIVLSMTSEVHDHDPTPEFPGWLAEARVVSELAQWAAREVCTTDPTTSEADAAPPGEPAREWPDVAPELVSREVIASSAEAESFGWHLEWKAWTKGVPAAARQAFVADGQAVNWTIHRCHFSQMTGILDLMHALSYAWQAGAAVEDPAAYRRYATWIWQGQVACVIAELRQHQQRLGLPDAGTKTSDPRAHIARAVTYYANHQHLMDYPSYRQQGLPLTSSHIESTIKLISARVKGTEKFWRQDHGESLLQLRADSLSDSKPLVDFWKSWRGGQTGSNSYRTAAV